MSTDPNGVGSPLRSKYANDPDMAELVELFVGELPKRLDAIDQAWRTRKIEDLQRIAHQLRGASASYGFPAIGSAAGSLEDRIRDLSADHSGAISSIKSGVDELVAICRRATAN